MVSKTTFFIGMAICFIVGFGIGDANKSSVEEKEAMAEAMRDKEIQKLKEENASLERDAEFWKDLNKRTIRDFSTKEVNISVKITDLLVEINNYTREDVKNKLLNILAEFDSD